MQSDVHAFKAPLLFRPYRAQDLPDIKYLVKNCLAEYNLSYDAESSEKDLDNIEDIYISSGGYFEVVEDVEAEIIGTLALLKVSDELCKLRKLYIRADYRGQGLGKLLLERFIHRARELNYQKILLETVDTLEEAVELYEKAGFRKVEGQPIESPRCNLVMELILLEE